MVTQVDVISTPPTPADAPEVFEERASQVWSDLARAVPQMNAQALENNAAANAADQAKNRAIAEADLAMGYRNAAQAAALQSSGFASDSNAAKLAAEQAQEASVEAKSDAQQVLSTMQDTLGAAVLLATTAAEEAKDDAESARDAAQASAAAWAYSMPALVKADPSTPCLIKTSTTALAIKAGTHVKIGSGYVSFAAQTAVTMPAVLVPGKDYAVFVHPDGAASAVADPFFAPAAAPVLGALKIGGFHYGLTAPGSTVVSGSFATTGAGMIWTQADVDNIAGINAFSIWDLVYRPKCDPRGMTRSDAGFWFDIYFCGTEHITNGTSRYNTDVASGTVLPKKPLIFGGSGLSKYTSLNWYEASEIAFSHGKRLMGYQEFSSAAYGVTENVSIAGAASTIPSTLRVAGYTSKFGGEQMTGNHYTWGGLAHGIAGASWVPGAVRGQTFGTAYGALFGGTRDSAGNSGSRCASFANQAFGSNWFLGLRAACDHYQGGY